MEYGTPHWAKQSQGSGWLAILSSCFPNAIAQDILRYMMTTLCRCQICWNNWVQFTSEPDKRQSHIFGSIRLNFLHCAFSNVSSTCTGFMMFVSCCWNNWVQFTTEQPEAENNWLSFTFLLKRKFICQLFCAFLLKRTKSLTWINFKKKVLLCSLSEYMLRQVWTKNPKQCFSKLLLSITPVPSFRVRGLLQK